jgi:hypothetical protein
MKEGGGGGGRRGPRVRVGGRPVVTVRRGLFLAPRNFFHGLPRGARALLRGEEQGLLGALGSLVVGREEELSLG